MVLVLALVAALAILVALRRRSERAYVAKLRDREEQLKLALWATGEHYWDYDLASGKLRRFQPDDETTRADGPHRLSGPVTRRSVVSGKRWSVPFDLGGART